VYSIAETSVVNAVTAVVITAVTDQCPPWVVYTLIKVAIRPMREFSRAGLLSSMIGS
jgi:hypothetical protein